MNDAYIKAFVDLFNGQDVHLYYFDDSEYFQNFLDFCQTHGMDLSSYSVDEIKGALTYAYSISNKGNAASSLSEMAKNPSPISFGMAGICTGRCNAAGLCGKTAQSMNPIKPMSYSAAMNR